MEKLLERIEKEVKKELKEAQTATETKKILRNYLGKSGRLSLILGKIKTLSDEEKKDVGRKANELKSAITQEIEKKLAAFKEASNKNGFDIDFTTPGKKVEKGHLHPLTQARREIMFIFQQMGFDVLEGPEIETEWYNFDALNIPKDHPARDAWDTFWLKAEGEKLLLRTHTSPVQARYMEKNQPPLKIIVPGKAFRHEATDASHEMQFYQIEGLMVDENVSVSHMKAIIGQFFRAFFGKELDFRFRPDFFPFTEPSFEIAMSCLVCGGEGCPVCKNTGWLEVAGAGMVHPKVFKASKLDPRQWQGWAFGFGWDRLAMMKYKIDDIRLFNSGDLRFLNQF